MIPILSFSSKVLNLFSKQSLLTSEILALFKFDCKLHQHLCVYSIVKFDFPRKVFDDCYKLSPLGQITIFPDCEGVTKLMKESIPINAEISI